MRITYMGDNTAIIRQAYYNPKTGFIGADKLYQKLKKQKVTKKQIVAFLKNQEVVQINKKDRTKARSFVPPGIRYEFQVDLIYLDNAGLNENNRYALCCIDIFSKVAAVELLKKRDVVSVVAAMRKILNRMGIPKYIFSDRGSEFIATAFGNLLKQNNITQLFTIGHAAFVEVFNRTFKTMLNRYLQSTKSKTFTLVVRDVVDNYNSTYHSAIKMQPDEVTDANSMKVYHNIYKHSSLTTQPPIGVGDTVRVTTEKVNTLYTGDRNAKKFKKGYNPKYSSILHKISAIEDNRYYIDGHKDYYYRNQIKPSKSFESNPNAPQNVGSVEYRLKTLADARHKLALKDKIEGKPVISKNMADYLRVTRSKATEPVKEIVKPKIEMPKTLAEKREQIAQQPVRVSTRERVANKKYI